MEQSKLVPDDIMIRVVNERLQQPDCVKNGWVLDGFPRTKVQAEAMLKNGMVPDCFILLDVPQEVLVERVVGRRSDPLTGKVYHLKFNPPKDQQILQRLIQRHDDTAEVIVTRYRDYQLHTHEVRSYFEEMVITINGNTSKEIISSSILKALHKVSQVDKL